MTFTDYKCKKDTRTLTNILMPDYEDELLKDPFTVFNLSEEELTEEIFNTAKHSFLSYFNGIPIDNRIKTFYTLFSSKFDKFVDKTLVDWKDCEETLCQMIEYSLRIATFIPYDQFTPKLVVSTLYGYNRTESSYLKGSLRHTFLYVPFEKFTIDEIKYIIQAIEYKESDKIFSSLMMYTRIYPSTIIVDRYLKIKEIVPVEIEDMIIRESTNSTYIKYLPTIRSLFQEDVKSNKKRLDALSDESVNIIFTKMANQYIANEKNPGVILASLPSNADYFGEEYKKQYEKIKRLQIMKKKLSTSKGVQIYE